VTKALCSWQPWSGPHMDLTDKNRHFGSSMLRVSAILILKNFYVDFIFKISERKVILERNRNTVLISNVTLLISILSRKQHFRCYMYWTFFSHVLFFYIHRLSFQYRLLGFVKRNFEKHNSFYYNNNK